MRQPIATSAVVLELLSRAEEPLTGADLVRLARDRTGGKLRLSTPATYAALAKFVSTKHVRRNGTAYIATGLGRNAAERNHDFFSSVMSGVWSGKSVKVGGGTASATGKTAAAKRSRSAKVA